jgi:hypothetical protein
VSEESAAVVMALAKLDLGYMALPLYLISFFAL